MDIISYLKEFGKELSGLNTDPIARGTVLRYALDRLREVAAMVEKEVGDVNDDADEER
jgi:hypothetical protein